MKVCVLENCRSFWKYLLNTKWKNSLESLFRIETLNFTVKGLIASCMISKLERKQLLFKKGDTTCTSNCRAYLTLVIKSTVK